MGPFSTEYQKQDLIQKISKGAINQCLYKYREDNDFSEKILTDKTLWFSHPNEFNDPFDCWSNIQYLNKDELYNLLVQSRVFDESIKSKLKQGCNKFDTNKIKQITDSIINKIGVCCFSNTYTSILMWSHYANNHKGFCIEFDILVDPDLFCLALPVNYVKTMPEFNYPTEFNNIITNIIQPKYKDWEYEKEVRIIKPQSENEKNGSQAFSFKPESMKRIIFGCKAHKETIEKYIELCKKNGLKHVRFSQMHQKTNGSFELEEKTLERIS